MFRRKQITRCAVNAVVIAPTLWMGFVTEPSNSISPLAASSPARYNAATRMLYVSAAAFTGSLATVCTDSPVLAVEIRGAASKTNELQTSTDLIHWSNTNIRSHGKATNRFYQPTPSGSQFYRVVQR